jgi:putative salt-induced outer membrane protein YdiY
MRIAASFVLLLVMTASVFADDDPPPPLWMGRVSASYVANSGNTNNSTLGSSGELVWQPGQYRAVLAGEFIRTESENKLGSKRLGASVRLEHTLPLRLSVYTSGTYYDDPPSGTQHQYAVNVGGLGHVIKGVKHLLAVSLSLTQTWENRVIMPDREFLGGQLGVDVRISPNDIVTAEHASSVVRDFSDSSNWRARSSTALTVAMNTHLAFKFSHQLYRNKPDPGKRSTDQMMMASLVLFWPGRERN